MHLRIDGPSFDAMDATTGRNTPKLQFSGFLTTLRRNQASVGLLDELKLEEEDHGIDCSSRPLEARTSWYHRAFPLIELI